MEDKKNEQKVAKTKTTKAKSTAKTKTTANTKKTTAPKKTASAKKKVEEIKVEQPIEEPKEVKETVKTETKKQEKVSEKDNTFKSSEVMFLIILTCIVSVIMGWTVCYKTNLKTKKISGDKNLDQFITTYNTVTENYYGDIDKEKLIKGAIDGMLSGLDDNYSTIIDDTSKSSFDAELEGRYTGIGIEVTSSQDGKIYISKVFENTPAYTQDVKVGDIVTAIDDMDLKDKQVSDLVDYIGNNNKEFTIKLTRGKETLEKKLTKTVVTINSVSSKTFDRNNKKIGYIKIDVFSKVAAKQFSNILSTLEKENIDSLIIDVRDNTGGYLTTSSSIVSSFLDEKHVIYQIEQKGKTEKFYSSGKTTKTYPIVVLQNEESASAAELLSIALKEEYNAKVVGTKSYGKGTVQELITLPNGTEYKYTSKKWLSPKGNWVNGTGVTPDYEIELDEKYIKEPNEDNDNQLQKALSILAE